MNELVIAKRDAEWYGQTSDMPEDFVKAWWWALAMDRAEYRGYGQCYNDVFFIYINGEYVSVIACIGAVPPLHCETMMHRGIMLDVWRWIRNAMQNMGVLKNTKES